MQAIEFFTGSMRWLFHPRNVPIDSGIEGGPRHESVLWETVAPPRAGFEYSFDNLAEVIGSFVDALGLNRYALYIFDYGAPTGLRLAMKHPERVTAIVTQNGNAYVEGLSKEWEPWQAYWRSPTLENRERCRASLSDDAIRIPISSRLAGRACRTRRLHARPILHGPARGSRYPARSRAELSNERRALPTLPAIFSRAPTAAAGSLGQERSILHPARRRSLQTRSS